MKDFRFRPMFTIVLAAVAASIHSSSYAEEPVKPAETGVMRSSANGFSIRHQTEIPEPPAEVFRTLTEDVSEWWDAAHTFSGDASNLSIDARARGCFCEALPNGGSVRHLTVVHADPGKLLRMIGALGPLQAEAVTGAMSWTLEDVDAGTRLVLTYRVSGSVEGGLDGWAEAVARVLREQLDRLAAYAGKRAD